MAGEILIFDATGSNVDGTDPGTALEAGPNDDVKVIEFDAPAPSPQVIYAGSIDTEGGLPAARKHDNRFITLKLRCETPAALRQLQAKVGKVAREGGTLKWILPNAETVIFDLLNEDTFAPTINKLFYVRAGSFTDVQVSFVAKPYGRGPSVTLTGHTATSNAPLVFTETGIKGDWYGLGSLTVANATTGKKWLTWGLRSRYYDADDPLFMEAEAQSADGAAANAGYSGASGATASKVMRHSNVGTSGATSFFLSSPNSAHIGTYRAFARVQADSGNTGTVSVRLQYVPRGLGPTVNNDWVAVADAGTPVEGAWVLVDLGLVILPRAHLGTQQWTANFQAKSTVSTDDLDWDWVALVPVDEGYGRVVNAVANVLSTGAVLIAHDTVQLRNASSGYYDPAKYEGCYLLIPPAGAEGRTAEFIVIFTATSSGTLTDTVVDATNLDAISGSLTYTPRYLVIPEP